MLAPFEAPFRSFGISFSSFVRDLVLAEFWIPFCLMDFAIDTLLWYKIGWHMKVGMTFLSRVELRRLGSGRYLCRTTPKVSPELFSKVLKPPTPKNSANITNYTLFNQAFKPQPPKHFQHNTLYLIGVREEQIIIAPGRVIGGVLVETDGFLSRPGAITTFST